MTRGQHDYGTSRLVDSEWTGSPPNGEPRIRAPAAPTPDSDSDGTYHHGTALNLDLSSDARPGSDSCTNATHKGTRPGDFGPGTIGIRVSSSPSRPGHHWPGPSTSSTSGHTGPRVEPLITSQTGTPFRGFQVSLNNRLQRVTFSFPITSQTGFAPCLQNLHVLLAPRGHLIPDFDNCVHLFRSDLGPFALSNWVTRSLLIFYSFSLLHDASTTSARIFPSSDLFPTLDPPNFLRPRSYMPPRPYRSDFFNPFQREPPTVLAPSSREATTARISSIPCHAKLL